MRGLSRDHGPASPAVLCCHYLTAEGAMEEQAHGDAAAEEMIEDLPESEEAGPSEQEEGPTIAARWS